MMHRGRAGRVCGAPERQPPSLGRAAWPAQPRRLPAGGQQPLVRRRGAGDAAWDAREALEGAHRRRARRVSCGLFLVELAGLRNAVPWYIFMLRRENKVAKPALSWPTVCIAALCWQACCGVLWGEGCSQPPVSTAYSLPPRKRAGCRNTGPCVVCSGLAFQLPCLVCAAALTCGARCTTGRRA